MFFCLQDFRSGSVITAVIPLRLMRYRLSTLIAIVTLSAILAGGAARYYNRPSNVDLLIAHMDALPTPCTYSQFENLANKLSFQLNLVLGSDDCHYWDIEHDEGSSHFILQTEFRIVSSDGNFVLGDWKILNNTFQLRPWDGEQVWPKKPLQ